MTIKIQSVPAYEGFLEEINNLIDQQEAFNARALEFVCEAERLDKAQDSFF